MNFYKVNAYFDCSLEQYINSSEASLSCAKKSLHPRGNRYSDFVVGD